MANDASAAFDWEKNKPGCIGCLVIIAICVILATVVTICNKDPEPKLTPEQEATQAQERQQRRLVSELKRAIERWVEYNLGDPDSFEIIDWEFIIPDDKGYRVVLRFRAKNAFGGMIIEEARFFIIMESSEGRVWKVEPIT